MGHTPLDVTAYRAAMGPRLARHVAAKLGAPLEAVAFVRWDRDPKTGADIPVFRVPGPLMPTAIGLGLAVE